MDSSNNNFQEKLPSAVLTTSTTISYSKTKKRDLVMVFSISIIIALGTIVSSYLPFFLNTAWAQQNVTSSSSTSTGKPSPTDEYSKAEGHLTAIRHIFDDPSLRVQHYCKPNDKILLVCQLYDSNSPNANTDRN